MTEKIAIDNDLARIVNTPNYTIGDDSARLSRTLDRLGTTLRGTASGPGFSGKAGDDASEMFVQQSRRAFANADVHSGVQYVFSAANAALDHARAESANLPVGQMTRRERAAVVGGAWVLLGPFGTVHGIAGAHYANKVLDYNRDHICATHRRGASGRTCCACGRAPEAYASVASPGRRAAAEHSRVSLRSRRSLDEPH